MRSVFRWIRRRRQLEHVLPWALQIHFVACNFLNHSGIGLQSIDLQRERLVLRIQLVDLAAQLRNLILRAAHGQKPVSSEEIVKCERENRNAQNGSKVALEEIRWLLGRISLSAGRHELILSVRRGFENPRTRVVGQLLRRSGRIGFRIETQ